MLNAEAQLIDLSPPLVSTFDWLLLQENDGSSE